MSFAPTCNRQNNLDNMLNVDAARSLKYHKIVGDKQKSTLSMSPVLCSRYRLMHICKRRERALIISQ